MGHQTIIRLVWAASLAAVLAACTAPAPSMPPAATSPAALPPSQTAPAPSAVPTMEAEPTSSPAISPEAPAAVPLPMMTATPAGPAAVADLPPITPENAARLGRFKTIPFTPWDFVMAVAWSPDGIYLAASVGAKILLFDTRLWEPQAVVEVGAFTHSLAFSPNGTLLASASRDGWVRVWSVPALLQGESGRLPLLALEAHEKGANKVAFSPDGSILASGGNDALARFWDLATGESLGLMIGGTYAVPSIAFAPSGATLAVVNGEVVRLREVGSERITGTLRAKGPLYNVAYSPDGNILAASDLDNAIHLWDPALAFRTGQEQYPQAQVLSGHTGSPGTYRALVWELAFSPDGALLASVGGDGALIVWDLAAGQPGALLQAHSRAATSVAFHPGGRALASGGLDGMLVIWGVMP